MNLAKLIGLCLVAGFLGSCCWCPRSSHNQVSSYRYSAKPQPVALGMEQPERRECQDMTTDPSASGQPSSGAVAGPENPLPVILRCQEGLYTCWATSAEMIMEFIGGQRIRQCTQASAAFPSQTCCGGNDVILRSPFCDQPGRPDFLHWGYDFDYRRPMPNASLTDPGGHLSFDEIKQQIQTRKPFAFAWATVNPAGQVNPVSHMMVVIGYVEDLPNGIQRLRCLNPGPTHQTDPVWVEYSDYAGMGPHYRHREDFFNIRPRTVPSAAQ